MISLFSLPLHNPRGTIYGVVLITLSQGKMWGEKGASMTPSKVIATISRCRAMQQCENAECNNYDLRFLMAAFHLVDFTILDRISSKKRLEKK